MQKQLYYDTKIGESVTKDKFQTQINMRSCLAYQNAFLRRKKCAAHFGNPKTCGPAANRRVNSRIAKLNSIRHSASDQMLAQQLEVGDEAPRESRGAQKSSLSACVRVRDAR
jgi:hypothetical protein